MSRSLRVGFVAVAAGSAALIAVPSPAWSAPKASISSVTVSGSASHPVVTILGHYFGHRPTPRPRCRPGNFNQCGHFSGRDFGIKLYFVERSNTRFSAGRFRPRLSELDAIGLVVTTYTSSKIVYHFGSGYHHGHSRYGWQLKNGDHYSVTVDGAHHTGNVHY
jgi:hypothetical protein